MPNQLPLAPGKHASIREIMHFRRRPLVALPEIAAEFGPVARTVLGRQESVLVSDPELIRQVLVTDDWNFTKSRALARSKKLLGEGLLTSEGELHRRQRRLMQPAFNHDRLRGYAAQMVRIAEQTAERWQAGSTIEAHSEMMQLTLEIVAATLFGSSLAQEQGLGRNATAIIEEFDVMAGPWQDWLDRMPTPATRRFWAQRERLDAVVFRLIEERRANPGRHDDLLALLVGSHDEGDTSTMSDILLRDEVMTILMAGHETTANALTFSLWLLSQHPQVAERVYAEVDAALAGRAGTMDDLPKLAYTRQVAAEAMRLYPPAWLIGRTAVTDIAIGGYRVLAGTIVILSPWLTQRDPRWFDAPLEFRPERWLPEAVASRPKFSYFPFGAGTRMCIGEQFAWMEATLALATLLQRWRVVAGSGTPRKLELLARITLRPKGGVLLTMERRG